MANRRALSHEANRLLRTGDPETAMRGFVALIRSAPQDLDSRLRVADALLSAGDPARAVPAYAFVVRESAGSGHPLKAIAALKVLAQLDPGVNELLASLAQRYGQGAQSLGRAVRLAPPDPTAEVPVAAFLPAELTTAQVHEIAGQAAVNREALPGWPATVAPIPLLSDLPPEAFARMLASVQLRRVPAGEPVIREGEPGDGFFMLARGSVRVTKRQGGGGTTGIAPETDVVLATLGEGSIFGEMALVSGAPRAATVSAGEDSDVLSFGKEALQAVARELPVIASALERFTRERLLQNLLATHPFFKPFDKAQRQQLATRFSAHDASPGTVLIREGDTGRGIFLILSGEVDVTKTDGADRVQLAVLKSGDVFGEISLVEQAPTTATVTAARPTTVLFLAREIFDRLVQGVPALREYFHTLAEERQMDTNLTLASARNADHSFDVEIDDDELVLV